MIRIRHIVENYKATGSFSLKLSPEILEWIKVYKTDSDKQKYKRVIKDALEYLRKEAEV